ncbi:ribonuclease H-like domain-containing protein [Tanacetum coccineum]
MWLFRHKHLADVTLSRYKARLVANGSTQLSGIDVDEKPLGRCQPDTIGCTLVGYFFDIGLTQFDVKNAFLHGDLSKTRSLYGLNQALRAWFQRFAAYITRVGFTYSRWGGLHIVHCNLSGTPVDTESKLRVDGDPVSDSTLYRSFAGALQYLAFTRSNISYAVQQIGLVALLLDDQFLYCGVANAVAETCWLRNLLRELHTHLPYATLVYCNNVSAVYLSSNPVHHQRTKHIEIDIYFVHDFVVTGEVCVFHVPSRYQYAGIFTKG